MVNARVESLTFGTRPERKRRKSVVKSAAIRAPVRVSTLTPTFPCAVMVFSVTNVVTCFWMNCGIPAVAEAVEVEVDELVVVLAVVVPVPDVVEAVVPAALALAAAFAAAACALAKAGFGTFT